MGGSAPSAFRRASFSSDDDVAITVAPAALANWTAKNDTPPAPCVSTTAPGLLRLPPIRAPPRALLRPSATSARHAWSAAQGNVAAWAKLHPLGIRVKVSAGIATYSA